MYLVAIMDWHSRKVYVVEVYPIILDTDFCVEALYRSYMGAMEPP